jgi:acetyl esterase/lipase
MASQPSTRMSSLRLFLFCFVAFVSQAAEPGKLMLAHYMPWYATRQVSGQWGWHWTMNHYHPDQRKWDGKREAASHDYPLIGLYDSGDDEALECQVLLMKLAGLDGVIIDWYGTRKLNDYAVNHEHTLKLIPWLKKAGLRFALCYEDQAIGQMKLSPGDELKQGLQDLQWAEQQWFKDASYVKQGGRPVLMVFGPQHFKRAQWEQLRAALPSRPMIFGLPHLSKEHGMDGSYGWPPVSGGKAISTEKWHGELEALYARGKAGEAIIASAFPGFKDIYKQAGVHESYGSIAPRSGQTLAESLDMALKSSAALIQVATWNDYGEGTVIEPTHNLGYRYLEMLQKSKAAPPFSVADLRLPVMLYQLRKRSHGNAEHGKELNRAAALLFDARCTEAEAVLAKVRDALGQQPARFADTAEEADENYRLHTELLYREEKDITPAMNQRCRLDVYAPANQKPFPTLVWFHGGGLTAGERFIPLQLRNQGIAVVAVNYRLSPGVKAPAYIEDAAAAIAWTFKHIAGFGGSADQIFVGGHSAGAYLSLMTGLDRKWLAAHDIDASRIAGLIPLSPQVITHFAIRDERGIAELQPLVDDMAPLYHVRKDAAPILLVTGDREKEMMGRYEENAYFWRMLKLVGHKDVTLHELGGFSHGGMPEPAFPLVLKFMQEHAAKPVLKAR